jgi:hypothetical protein
VCGGRRGRRPGVHAATGTHGRTQSMTRTHSARTIGTARTTQRLRTGLRPTPPHRLPAARETERGGDE